MDDFGYILEDILRKSYLYFFPVIAVVKDKKFLSFVTKGIISTDGFLAGIMDVLKRFFKKDCVFHINFLSLPYSLAQISDSELQLMIFESLVKDSATTLFEIANGLVEVLDEEDINLDEPWNALTMPYAVVIEELNLPINEFYFRKINLPFYPVLLCYPVLVQFKKPFYNPEKVEANNINKMAIAKEATRYIAREIGIKGKIELFGLPLVKHAIEIITYWFSICFYSTYDCPLFLELLLSNKEEILTFVS